MMQFLQRPLIVAVVTLAAFLPFAAQSAEKLTEQERRHAEAYVAVVRAEQARDEGRRVQAVEMFAAALESYHRLARDYPGWRYQIIEARLPYCANELKSLLQDKELERRFGPSLKALLAKPMPVHVSSASQKASKRGSTSSAPPVAAGSAPASTVEAQYRAEIERLRTERYQLLQELAARPKKAEAREKDQLARRAHRKLGKDFAALQEDYAILLQRNKVLASRLVKLEEAERRAQSGRKARAAMEKQYVALAKRLDAAEKENKRLKAELAGRALAARSAREKDRPPRRSAEREQARRLAELQKRYKTLAAETARMRAHVARLEAHSPQRTTAAPPRPSQREEPSSPVGRARVEISSLLRKGDVAGADEQLSAALGKWPRDAALRLLKGMILCKEGNYRGAVESLRELVSEDPSNAKVRVVLGAAHMSLGEYDEARMELDVAVGFDPDMPEGHYDLAQVLLICTPPDAEKAHEHYQESLRLGARRDPGFEKRLAAARRLPASRRMPPSE